MLNWAAVCGKQPCIKTEQEAALVGPRCLNYRCVAEPTMLVPPLRGWTGSIEMNEGAAFFPCRAIDGLNVAYEGKPWPYWTSQSVVTTFSAVNVCEYHPF